MSENDEPKTEEEKRSAIARAHMINTPRTDALEFALAPVVHVNHARALEREVAAEKRRAEQAEERWKQYSEMHETAEAACNANCQTIATLTTELAELKLLERSLSERQEGVRPASAEVRVVRRMVQRLMRHPDNHAAMTALKTISTIVHKAIHGQEIERDPRAVKIYVNTRDEIQVTES